MPVNSWSDTSISVTIPSGATTGTVVVTVGGVSSNGVQFTVTSGVGVPNITSLSPSSASVGTSITITGTNFDSTGAVTFGSVHATPTSWSNTSIIVSVPTGAVTSNVVVTTAAGASNGVLFTVTSGGAGVPNITSLSPSAASVGTSITITGTNFDSTGAVTFGGVQATPTSWSNTSIVVSVPAGAVTGNVVVTTAPGASNGVLFTVTTTPAPPTGGTTFALVSITGGTTIPDGTYHGQAGISLFCSTAWSPSITLAVGASVYVQGTGSYDGYFTLAGISTGPDNFGMSLVAGTNSNTNIVLQQGSIILGGTPSGGSAATLTSITPSSAAANTALVTTLGGTGFTGATAVNYSGTGITTKAPTVASDTSLSTTFGISLSASSGNVTVTTPGYTSNSAGFTVTAWVPPAGPLINSVSPTSGSAGTAVPITLSGSGFTGNPGIAPTTVGYSGTGGTISSVVVVGDNQITATLTLAAGATSGILTVTTPSGTSNGAAFTVSGTAAPTTPAGYLAFIYGGTAQGIYASVQTPMPASLAVGNSVTISGTGSYDGTFTVAHISSATDLFLNPGTNSATVIVSKQGLIQYP